jgi:hypothetical protein
MRSGVTGAEICGYCESRDTNRAKTNALKEQIKAINKDSAELTKITAKDFDTKAADLNAVYKRYVEIKEKGEEETDFYELLALLEDELEGVDQVKYSSAQEDDE